MEIDIESKRAQAIERKTEARRQYYNPVHNIPQNNGYDISADDEKGVNFDITSK